VNTDNLGSVFFSYQYSIGSWNGWIREMEGGCSVLRVMLWTAIPEWDYCSVCIINMQNYPGIKEHL
jgi:hypothetical protein